LQKIVKDLLERLLRGETEANFPFDTIDLKMAIIRVNCWNECPSYLPCAGEKIMTSEGSYMWAMAYRWRH
jgi:hypothetical protein